MKKMNAFFLSLLAAISLHGQVLWTIPNVSFEQGDTVSAEFYVYGFNSIGAFSHVMRHDTAILERIAVTFTGQMPGFLIQNFSFHQPGWTLLPGEIRTLRSQAQGTTVEDGTHVYTVKFAAKQSGSLSQYFTFWAEHPVLHPTAIICTDAPPYMQNVALDIAYIDTGESVGATSPTQHTTLFTISPNPATDTSTLCVELETPQSIMINVFDAQGYAVFGELAQHKGGKQCYTITFPAQSGMYYVRVQHGTTCVTKTIVKN